MGISITSAWEQDYVKPVTRIQKRSGTTVRSRMTSQAIRQGTVYYIMINSEQVNEDGSGESRCGQNCISNCYIPSTIQQGVHT